MHAPYELGDDVGVGAPCLLPPLTQMLGQVQSTRLDPDRSGLSLDLRDARPQAGKHLDQSGDASTEQVEIRRPVEGQVDPADHRTDPIAAAHLPEHPVAPRDDSL